MIIEFVGIPGSGKTFYASQYKKKLESCKKSYIDISICKDTKLWIKLLFVFVKKTHLLFPRYRAINKELLSICRKYDKEEPAYLPFSLQYCVRRIILSIVMRDIFSKFKRDIINDEGLLQWIAFIHVLYAIPITELIDYCNYSDKNCKTFFFSTPINVAKKNIENRNRHDCLMDELSTNDLINYLNDYQRGIIEICNYMRVHDINEL